MNFNRIRTIEEPIELTSTSQVDLKLTFKQYDIGTSFLILKMLFEGRPAVFSGEKVYVTYKTPTKKYNVFAPLLKEDGTRIVDKGSYKARTPGELNIEISEDVLNYSGTILAELIIIDPTGKRRFTSPVLVFNVISSLTQNMVATTNMFKCGQLLCGEVVPNNTGEEIQTTFKANEEIKIKSFLSEKFIENNKELINEVRNNGNR